MIFDDPSEPEDPRDYGLQDWGLALLFSAERTDRALAGWGPVDMASYLERLARRAAAAGISNAHMAAMPSWQPRSGRG